MFRYSSARGRGINGRPARPDVKYFQRKLGDAERAIMLAAGRGDMSVGFMEVLDTYRHFYNLGLRPGMNLESVRIVSAGVVVAGGGVRGGAGGGGARRDAAATWVL